MEKGIENKPIPGFKGYRITKCGKVWSDKSSKFLKPWPRKNYLLVKLSVRGTEKTLSVHRLVLTTYCRAPRKNEEAMHLNGDSFDNRLENLKWGSAKENTSHRLIQGTVPTKLTKKQVLEIRGTEQNRKTQIALSKKYGVSHGQIRRIQRRESWTWL